MKHLIYKGSFHNSNPVLEPWVTGDTADRFYDAKTNSIPFHCKYHVSMDKDYIVYDLFWYYKVRVYE